MIVTSSHVPHLISPVSMFVVWSVHHVYIAHYVCLYTSRLFPPFLLALGWSCLSTENIDVGFVIWDAGMRLIATIATGSHVLSGWIYRIAGPDNPSDYD